MTNTEPGVLGAEKTLSDDVLAILTTETGREVEVAMAARRS